MMYNSFDNLIIIFTHFSGSLEVRQLAKSTIDEKEDWRWDITTISAHTHAFSRKKPFIEKRDGSPCNEPKEHPDRNN
jgi:hypothetical protein